MITAFDDPVELEMLSSILKILGNKVSLRILNEASTGFKSGNEIINRLDLNSRMFYRCLKKLKDLGIIDQSDKNYVLTQLGTQIYNMIFRAVLQPLSTDQKIVGSLQEKGEKSQILVINDYQKLVDSINFLIENSTSEILLLTKYLDLTVIQNLIKAINRDVKVKSITDKNIDFPSFFKLLSIFVKNIRPNLLKFFSNGSNYKVGVVPFSLVIIDNYICIYELPSEDFHIAFLLNDKKAINKISKIFWEIWDQSNKMEIPKVISEKTEISKPPYDLIK
ncbi:MAG: winged helix-turn-helix domain-containing protein [Promethearchaeota archaeon]|jgi:DNA-binding HxlR family transcriptional regulator